MVHLIVIALLALMCEPCSPVEHSELYEGTSSAVPVEQVDGDSDVNLEQVAELDSDVAVVPDIPGTVI